MHAKHYFRTVMSISCSIIVAFSIRSAPSWGDEFRIDWHTIDGGGSMDCTGGGFELMGTIGQHDAGPASTGEMTGGGFSLVGGFWALPPVPSCACPADVSGDNVIDGMDVQLFVDCALGAGSNCGCADLTAPAGSIDAADVTAFADALLTPTPCP